MTKQITQRTRKRGKKVFAGRYAYSKPLGRGAGGAVYLASDLLAEHRQVAVKVLTADACATVKGKMLRREFEILSKLNHPNLVRVYDYGSLGDGGLFLAEEYVDGFSLQDARALLEPSAMINVTIQLLQGLSYLHGMGMIHRDIKPANVMLLWLDDASALPMVKLVDFGLSSMDASGDTLRGGTRSYMAPEVVEGQQAELRSDLYSLGVTLYYTLCGVLPFGPRSKDDPAPDPAVFCPPAPHHLNEDVPLTLSRFTMALLRLIPDVDYADAGQAFQALAADTDAFEELSAGRLANSMDVAAIPVLKGYFERGFLERRVEEDEQLVEWITDNSPEHIGKLYIIEGEIGVGKSSLLKDVETSCKLSGQLVLHTTCTSGMKPYEMVCRFFYQIIELVEGRHPGSMDPFTIPVLVREKISALATGSSHEQVALPDQSWMNNFFVHAMEMLDPERLVFFIDDIHLADDASIALVEDWYRQADVSYRADILVTAEPHRHTTKLMALAGAKVLDIEGLTQEDVHNFYTRKLGIKNIPPSWIESVSLYADGQPAYIDELCRYLIDIGILRLQSARAWEVDVDELETFQIPTGIRESFWRRLTGIGAGDRECLELLALLGRPVKWESIRELLIEGGTSFDNAERILRTLQWRHLTMTDLEMNGRWVYLIHDELGDAIKDLISPEWKRALHRRIGKQLLQTWQSSGTDPYEAAQHLMWGGVTNEARELFEVAGDYAWEKQDYQDAYTNYEQSRALHSHGASAVSLEMKLAHLALINFHPARCREHVEHAASMAQDLSLDGLRFRVLVGAASMALTLGDFDATRYWCNQLVTTLPMLSQQGDIIEVEAAQLVSVGKLSIAEKVLDTCISRARHFGNRLGLASALHRKAQIKALQGEVSDALMLYDDAVDIATTLENQSLLGSILCSYGADIRAVGRLHDAMEMFMEAMTVLKTGERPEDWVRVLLELGECCFEMGDIVQADKRAKDAYFFATYLQHKWLIARCEFFLTRLHLYHHPDDKDAADKLRAIAMQWLDIQDYAAGSARMAIDAGRVLSALTAGEKGADIYARGIQLVREIGASGLT